MQVFMPTSAYEDVAVEDLYNIMEEIFGEDGKGARSIIVFGDWNSGWR